MSVTGRILGGWVGKTSGPPPIDPPDPPEPGDRTFLLDKHTNAIGAWSVMQDRSDYTGPLVRIERQSDGGQVDVYPHPTTYDIQLDSPVQNASIGGPYTDLAAFAGVDNCRIRTLYDQTDAARNLTLRTSPNFENNPHLLYGGVLITETDEDGWIDGMVFPRGMIRFISQNDSTDNNSVGNLDNNTFGQLDLANMTTFLTSWNKDGPYNNNDRPLMSFESWGNWPHLGAGIRWGTKEARSEPMSGSLNTLAVCTRWTSLACRIFHSTPTEVSVYINRVKERQTATMPENIVGGIVLGGNSKGLTNGAAHQDFASLIIFPALSEANRNDVLDAFISQDWDLDMPEAEDVSESKVIMWTKGAQVIHDHLASFTEADFELPWGASVSYTEGGTLTEKRNLWVYLERGTTGASIEGYSESKHYVKDDGAGSGWDGNDPLAAKVFLPVEYKSNYWYDQTGHIELMYKLTGPGIANPVYQSKALARRALAVGYLHALNHLEDNLRGDLSTSWGDAASFIGPMILNLAGAFEIGKSLMSEEQQKAYRDVLFYNVFRLAYKGSNAINDNMDCRALPAFIRIYKLFPDDTRLRQICVVAAKKLCYGEKDGDLQNLTTQGLFSTDGNVREGIGPASSYYGRSWRYLARALVYAQGESEWDFVQEFVDLAAKFVAHTRMCIPYDYGPDEPNDLTTKGGFTAGSSRANRYQSPMTWQAETWVYLAAATYTQYGSMMLTYNWRYGRAVVPDDDNFGTKIASLVGELSAVNKDMSTGRRVGRPQYWPKYLSYIEDGPLDWGAILRAKLDSDDWKAPMEPTLNATHNVIMPDAVNATPGDALNQIAQWWSRRDTYQGRDFGYQIEGVFYSGSYSGYFSGTILGMGAMDQGPVVESYRENYGLAYSPDNADLRRISHVWGVDEDNYKIDFGDCQGRSDSNHVEARTLDWTDGDAAGVGAIKTVTTPMRNDGQDNPSNPFTAELLLEAKFTGLVDGLRITNTLLYSGLVALKEMWYTLPIRESDDIRLSQRSPDVLTIEHAMEADGSWTTSPTSRAEFTARYVRVGVDWGNGLKYSYFDYGSDDIVRLLEPQPEDNNALWLLDRNFHPDKGNDFVISSSHSHSVDWTVTDPVA